MAEHSEDLDIALIGGGPTGLAAGPYAARALRRAVLWEHAVPGGQIANAGSVENHPRFPQGVNGSIWRWRCQQAERFGMGTRYEPVPALRRASPYYILGSDSGAYLREQ